MHGSVEMHTPKFDTFITGPISNYLTYYPRSVHLVPVMTKSAISGHLSCSLFLLFLQFQACESLLLMAYLHIRSCLFALCLSLLLKMRQKV